MKILAKLTLSPLTSLYYYFIAINEHAIGCQTNRQTDKRITNINYKNNNNAKLLDVALILSARLRARSALSRSFNSIARSPGIRGAGEGLIKSKGARDLGLNE